jgi:single-strand DNA-binding protein
MSKIQNRKEVKTMLNQCTLMGNLGGDPEVFYSSEGNPVASFSLASHSSKKKTGWIKVVCFQKLAEVTQKYLHKGARIAVIGTLDHHKWETDEGVQRASFPKQYHGHDRKPFPYRVKVCLWVFTPLLNTLWRRDPNKNIPDSIENGDGVNVFR